MSLHLLSRDGILEPICGTNAARLTDDPNHPSLSCHLCLELIQWADAALDIAGQVACTGGHEDWWIGDNPCPWCRARV